MRTPYTHTSKWYGWRCVDVYQRTYSKAVNSKTQQQQQHSPTVYSILLLRTLLATFFLFFSFFVHPVGGYAAFARTFSLSLFFSRWLLNFVLFFYSLIFHHFDLSYGLFPKPPPPSISLYLSISLCLPIVILCSLIRCLVRCQAHSTICCLR